MFEMPSTMVRKMIGPMTIFTSFTKVSPTGRMARPSGGSIAPSSAPRATAHRTWKGRLPARRFMRGTGIEGQEIGRGDPEQHGQEEETEEDAQPPECPVRKGARGV